MYLKKREKDEAPIGAQRAENFQGLEINFQKVLLDFSMRPLDLEALGVMRALAP